MGHDIYAYRNNVDRDAVARELRLDQHDDGWLNRHSKYELRTQVAYLRRSAFDPLGRAIYRALSVEELDGGCSGCGSTRRFTLSDIDAAIVALPGVVADGPPRRERNMADDLVDALTAAGGFTNIQVAPNDADGYDVDVTPEREFLSSCREYLTSENEADLEIYFG